MLIEIQQKLNKALINSKISYALLIQENGKIFSKMKGCNRNSQFLIASLSKQMTCLLGLRILAKSFPRQKLDVLIHKPLGVIFPKSELIHTLPKNITPYHLMTNRSGLAWGENVDLTVNVSALERFQMIKSNGKIGEFDYSRVNCWILAHLLMEATGRSFEDIFAEFVSRPAHLKKTVAPVEGTFAEIKAKLPNLIDDSYPTNRDFSSCIGSANVISTPSDLIRWNNYLHNKLESKLRSVMLTFSHANKSFDYGMSLKSKNGRIWHTGHIGCFRSLLFNYEKKNVVLLTNDPTKYFVISDVLMEYLGVNCN